MSQHPPFAWMRECCSARREPKYRKHKRQRVAPRAQPRSNSENVANFRNSLKEKDREGDRVAINAVTVARRALNQHSEAIRQMAKSLRKKTAPTRQGQQVKFIRASQSPRIKPQISVAEFVELRPTNDTMDRYTRAWVILQQRKQASKSIRKQMAKGTKKMRYFAVPVEYCTVCAPK